MNLYLRAISRSSISIRKAYCARPETSVDGHGLGRYLLTFQGQVVTLVIHPKRNAEIGPAYSFAGSKDLQ